MEFVIYAVCLVVGAVIGVFVGRSMGGGQTASAGGAASSDNASNKSNQAEVDALRAQVAKLEREARGGGSRHPTMSSHNATQIIEQPSGRADMAELHAAREEVKALKRELARFDPEEARLGSADKELQVLRAQLLDQIELQERLKTAEHDLLHLRAQLAGVDVATYQKQQEQSLRGSGDERMAAMEALFGGR
jgi:polyhydroxyalkanoate synthesis regulator phasin